MCGVCGLLGGGPHWSAASGVLDEAQLLTARAERARMVAQINQLTALRAVKVATWSGSSLIVSGPTGAQEIVPSLSELWAAVDRLGRRPIDPLDDEYLQHAGARHD